MKVDHMFSAEARASVFCSDLRGRVALTFRDGPGGDDGISVALWLTRQTFDAFTVEAEIAIMQADRIAAAKRGEAVPAAPVSDGEAARELLRMWVEARKNPNVEDQQDPKSLDEYRAFLAAAAFLGVKVAS